MFHWLPFSFFLVTVATATAQSGTVSYAVTSESRIELPPEALAMGITMPATQTLHRRLVFDGSTGRTEDDTDRFDDGSTSESNVATLRGSGMVVYVDLQHRKRVRQYTLLGRVFLIEDVPTQPAWRLTEEEGTFLGHPVQKATALIDSVQVEAWFAPDIAAPVGPDKYAGLPGLILVLTETGGKTYTATQITRGPEGGVPPLPPTDGRRVTRAEYDAIMRERMEALRTQRLPAGTFIVPVN